MKKMLAALMVMAVAIFVPVCTMADDIDIIYAPTASGFFSSYSASLSKTGTTIHISFRTVGVETMDQIGVLTYDVQRLVGGTWTTVASGLAGSIGTDRSSHSFSKNYSAAAGYSYRVKAKHYALKYNGTSATATATSGSISV